MMGGRQREGEDLELREPKRVKAQSTAQDDSDSISSDSDSSDDDGPPVATTSKLPSPPLVEKFSTPSIHPSRVAAQEDTIVATDAEKAGSIQVVCRHWRKGNCSLAAECPYLHSVRPP